jgi:hypothetical protein
MKNLISNSLRRLWLVVALVAAGGCATVNRPEAPGTLRVAVNLPPAMNIAVEDEISQALVDRVRAVFQQHGFNRPVERAYSVNLPANAAALTLNMLDWRIDNTGFVECTFGAVLQTPAGTRDFGLYTGSTPSWLEGPGRVNLERSFDAAADGAVRQLFRDIQKTDLLNVQPGAQA